VWAVPSAAPAVVVSGVRLEAGTLVVRIAPTATAPPRCLRGGASGNPAAAARVGVVAARAPRTEAGLLRFPSGVAVAPYALEGVALVDVHLSSPPGGPVRDPMSRGCPARRGAWWRRSLNEVSRAGHGAASGVAVVVMARTVVVGVSAASRAAMSRSTATASAGRSPWPVRRRNCCSASSVPAAVQRRHMSPLDQCLTLRETRRRFRSSTCTGSSRRACAWRATDPQARDGQRLLEALAQRPGRAGMARRPARRAARGPGRSLQPVKPCRRPGHTV
jgi:hypothetical protein